jgi:environmental stress-induced protein Ves
VSAPAFERVALRTIAPQPWKNGAGLTREIAVGGTSAADFDWRISIAEVERDAPFSAFAGIDRCITLLHGAGMRLRSHDGRLDHALTTPLAPFRFPGDVALDATLVDGACSDFNVMTRRGRFRSEVDVHRDAATLHGADAGLLWCCAGSWQVGNETLGAAQGLLWRTPRDPVAVRPLDAHAALLHVRLCHDRSP